MGFLWNKVIFIKQGPLSTSTIELFVTIVDCWKLLTSFPSSLGPPSLNYDIQRTEKGRPNVDSVVEYVNKERLHIGFILNQKCNQDFNETVSETLSMSGKVFTLYRMGFFGAAHG